MLLSIVLQSANTASIESKVDELFIGSDNVRGNGTTMQKRREPVCGWTHLVGAVLSLVGLGWLIHLTRDNPNQLIPVLIFGASLLIVYTSSTVLHFTECSGRSTRLGLRDSDQIPERQANRSSSG